jgi:hypothetical protein
MAVWSEISLSQVESASRLDAEYYQPEYLSLSDALDDKKPHHIGDFAFVTDGIHASPDIVTEGGVRYLSAKCVKDNDFAVGDTLQINDMQHSNNKRTQMNRDDVLITTVGTIGNAAVVTDDLLPANADRHLGIIRINSEAGFDPYYLATFLNTKLGRFQTLSEATGNVQLNLFIEKIKTLRVVKVAAHDQIAELARRGYARRRDAEKLYIEAKELLESALRFDKLNLRPRLFYERSYADVKAGERLDAEYACIPDLLAIWNAPCPVRPLCDPVISKRVSNGATPASTEYGLTGVPIIKVGDITNHGTADFGGEFVKPGTKKLKSTKGRIKPGDVLVLAAAHHIRYIGRAGILEAWPDEQKKCQCVCELIAILPNEGMCGEVLACYLNSPTIRLSTKTCAWNVCPFVSTRLEYASNSDH